MYCSETCRNRAANRRNQWNHRARVRSERQALPAAAKSCKDCGTTVNMDWQVGRYKKPGSAGSRCHPCYLIYCQEKWRARQIAKGLAPLRRPRLSAEQRAARARPEPTRSAGTSAECTVCGAMFIRGKHKTASKVCSDGCRTIARKAVDRRKNARRKGARIGARYTLADVIARDGDKCHLCKRKVDLSLPGTDSRGPTVDHLLPISAGGADELANVRLAHRSCNCRRGVRGDVQLLLFG